MFPYSGASGYQKQVNQALQFDNPIAVVFKHEFPKTCFLHISVHFWGLK